LINLQRALLACWSQEAIHTVGSMPSDMNSVTRPPMALCGGILVT
jgi:hypothetical protein